MAHMLLTLAERPELEAEISQLHMRSWPTFIQADPVARQYWGRLFSTFAEYQYLLCDEQGQLFAAGHSIPLAWDGTVAGLPTGWDGALEQGFHDFEAGRVPNTLCGLSIVITPASQGQGLGEVMASAMKDIAATDGLDGIILPVRPSRKSQYPLIPMEHYIQWRQSDSSPFDPWLRIHQRLGASVLTIAPRSMVIAGTIAQWEEWTSMRFPTSGLYTISGALEPIVIDCERDCGRYEETNVWMCYTGSTLGGSAHSGMLSGTMPLLHEG